MQKQPSEVFCKRGVMRNFVMFTGKHKWWNLFFGTVRRCRFAFLLKGRLQRRFFPVNFEIFARTPFFAEQHRTTASYYGSINMGIGKRNCKLWYRNQSISSSARNVSYQKGTSKWKNRLNSYFRRRSLEQKSVRLSVRKTKINWRKVFAAAKISVSVTNLP